MSINILLDTLPETVTISGRDYFIDTDFRTCIIFEKVLSENLSSKELVETAVALFYTDEIPSDIEEAVKNIMYLYSCGEPVKQKRTQMNGDVPVKPKMIYSYEHDAPYIYGAFLSQYRIDLNDIDYLHWWKFQALFRSLTSDNKIVEIMGYRATDLRKIKDSAEKSRIRRLQEIYALPNNLSYEEKVAQAGAAFGGLM